MTQGEYTAAEHLQPASGSVSWVTGSVVDVVSGIRQGHIRLDVPDVEAWLSQFDRLVKQVEQHSARLRQAAAVLATEQSMGTFELSTQLRSKLVDRTGHVGGGLGQAMDEVVRALSDIHSALRNALVTQVESDEASARTLRQITEGTNPRSEPHG